DRGASSGPVGVACWFSSEGDAWRSLLLVASCGSGPPLRSCFRVGDGRRRAPSRVLLPPQLLWVAMSISACRVRVDAERPQPPRPSGIPRPRTWIALPRAKGQKMGKVVVIDHLTLDGMQRTNR